MRDGLLNIEVPQGAALGITKTGAIYARTHYTVDPGKRNPEWIASGRTEMGVREWDREMEMREDIWDGLPVFPEYQDDLHCPFEFRTKPIPAVMDRAVYLCGVDCGMTLRPAAALAQIVFGENRKEWQLQGLLEVTTDYALPMETFAPKLLEAVHSFYPEIADRIEYVGDETVKQRSGGRGETAQMVAQEHGIWIQPMPNVWEPRKSAVDWFLRKRVDENTPAMVIAGSRMPMLRKGFQGAYCLESKDNAVGPSAVLKMPVKNVFSHIHDGWQYLCLAAKREIESGNNRVVEMSVSF